LLIRPCKSYIEVENTITNNKDNGFGFVYDAKLQVVNALVSNDDKFTVKSIQELVVNM